MLQSPVKEDAEKEARGPDAIGPGHRHLSPAGPLSSSCKPSPRPPRASTLQSHSLPNILRPADSSKGRSHAPPAVESEVSELQVLPGGPEHWLQSGPLVSLLVTHLPGRQCASLRHPTQLPWQSSPDSVPKTCDPLRLLLAEALSGHLGLALGILGPPVPPQTCVLA